jgi:zinc transporter ZupT
MIEGSGVGSLFAISQSKGLLIAFAMGLHNIPEAVSACQIFMSRGESSLHAASRSCMVMFPQAATAIAAYLVVALWPAVFPLFGGFSAASMLYLVLLELLPRARTDLSDSTCAMTTVSSSVLFEAGRLVFDWMLLNPVLSKNLMGALAWSMLAGLSTGEDCYYC